MPIPTGLLGSEAALRGTAQAGLGQLAGFAQPGQEAFGVQAALSGGLGNQAQGTAFGNYLESPGQAFLRQQGERSVVNNAAALGGLGGGNVQKELTRFGQGLAATDFGNQFNRLGQVSGIGAQAAGQGANMIQNLGSQAAGDRLQIGRDIAGAIGSTTSALSNLASRQGSGLSDITGVGGGNLAQIIQQAGAGKAQSYENLGTILANIASQQGSTLASQPIIQPAVTNTLGQLGQVAGGVGGLLTGLGYGA